MELGTYVDATITAKVTARVKLEEGETVADFKNRFVDIYLHGAGEKGYIDKLDLGSTDVDIQVGSITKVE